METTPATQAFIFAPADPIYHLAEGEHLTACGRFIIYTSRQQRRRDDYRLSAEKPVERFTALCSECSHLAYGTPRLEVNPLVPRSRCGQMIIFP
jgi:hypothetical protein